MAQTRSIEDSRAIAAEIAARLRTLPGWSTDDIRAIRRDFTRQLSKTPPRILVDAARCLLENGGIDHRFVAYELVNKHREALASVDARDLETFGRGIDSWGSVDMFACFLSGPAWRERQVSDELIHRWARSRDRWWRRAALVSTVPLNNKARGGSGDSRRTLEVCRVLVDDRDDMVVKAMSWALRELSKRDRKAVIQFLDDHESELASRVIREVRSKLSTGLKNLRSSRRRTSGD